MVKLVKSIKAHQDKAWSVSSHPTLPLLVSASTDKTSKIYKLSSKQNFPLLADLEDTHKRSIRSVAFKPPLGGDDAPDGFLDLPALAAGSFDSTISIWGIDEPSNEYDDEELVANQQEIFTSPSNEWNLMAIIEGHENEIKSVEWNHTGNLLASCSRDKTVWIWETDPETLEEFECISVLNDHQHDIKNVTWHPNQNLLASSSYDDTIRLYKQDQHDDDWTCVGILNGHEGSVWCSKFEDWASPLAVKNRTRLVSASDDLTVRIWSCVEGEQDDVSSTALPTSIKHDSEMVWELETILPSAHKYPVYSVSWSKKTGKIASVGSDGRLVVYKEDEGKWSIESVTESSHGVFEINCVIWASLDDKTEVLVTAGDDGYINVWEV
ncbi:WD40 repeat-like protein [Suhomyces tanzawaensis NRRL Y-17324]|uniref:Probable cytosolic iron-sulfur protein assembly protein 1 n=1 Tax=Suhomyces tanzawaensis NRRL Y-17324 TaxID=984487 RepID=A0A1E4SGN0_9ASCO|nr:WD40 repeat-like protein [Suhomyces tanzawaensis NRRL Y-17324]ODV78636.1 WD40 repeat-like protein [Suhomyces tanzawaensis NRRL Y-17324]